jgi:hypothetical protein
MTLSKRLIGALSLAFAAGYCFGKMREASIIGVLMLCGLYLLVTSLRRPDKQEKRTSQVVRGAAPASRVFQIIDV